MKQFEIENWIDYSLFNENTYIIKAELKRMNRKIDITKISIFILINFKKFYIFNL